MSNVNYVFDVDGTLTPSRGKMDPAFKSWFIDWQKTHRNYLVTGSDYAKTVEQVGQEVVDNCTMLFNCCGNEIRKDGKIIHASDWKPSDELIAALERELAASTYPEKTGRHIEIRTGLLNFSIVGRNAQKAQRERYRKFDEETADRIGICLRLEREFEDIDFMVGGETGIDIYPSGRDKRQVLEMLDKSDPVVFYGDKTQPGGNDYPLAISVDIAHSVASWEETWFLLKLTK